ncbi:MAG: hypothetical protein DMF74_19580 [Acidobacteria bacterium]|nr:MAG: hypothetical protein DMF74_19580 [Acidobacteriota bacterium]
MRKSSPESCDGVPEVDLAVFLLWLDNRCVGKMMITMPKELLQAVRGSQGQPVRVADPETQEEYVVLPADMYERIEGLFYQDDPLTTDERRALLIKAGLRAGWDDPEMDIYNELDPRRES